MGRGDQPFDDRPASPHVFASALADLKQAGAAVLIVGDVPHCVSRTVRQRLFGNDGSQQRHRVHVSTGPEGSPPLPVNQRETDADHWTFINYTTEIRSVAQTASSTPNSLPNLSTTQECTTLSELGVTISDSIAEMESHCGGFAPAQLRVGFDSFTPIAEEDESTAFRFLHLLIERVTAANGMIHCPLHYPLDSRLVHLYGPLFDAIIELRVNDGEAQQRWYITDCDIHSAWLPAST